MFAHELVDPSVKNEDPKLSRQIEGIIRRSLSGMGVKVKDTEDFYREVFKHVKVQRNLCKYSKEYYYKGNLFLTHHYKLSYSTDKARRKVSAINDFGYYENHKIEK